MGKFADVQLRHRDNLTHCYNNMFEYNYVILMWIDNHRIGDPKTALGMFNRQQDNFLKVIVNCETIEVGYDKIIEYIYILLDIFIAISSFSGFIREMSAKVGYFQDCTRQAVDLLLLRARYYSGDFRQVYCELKQSITLETVSKLDRTIVSEQVGADIALGIYAMEGEALFSANYYAKHKLGVIYYPGSLLYLGEYKLSLAEVCSQRFFTLEVLGNMSMLKVENVDDYLARLYDKDHLNRMQVSYVRAKLMPLKRKKIEALVTINPYTKGLKSLMLAFIEQNSAEAEALFQVAIEQLDHIKYYCVEAMYFYAKFLQQHTLPAFDEAHQRGLALAKKHHYRFFQYRFEQLLNPTGIPYDARHYPLPGNPDYSDYIRYLIKYNKKYG